MTNLMISYWMHSHSSPVGKCDIYRRKDKVLTTCVDKWIALKYRNTLIYYDSIQGNMAFTVQKNDNTVHIKLTWPKDPQYNLLLLSPHATNDVGGAEYHQPQHLPHHV
ncbi:UNVERIFIED_CONTAM: hypothetical protein NCL1_21981 [Trichonephila clavipes]